MLLENKKKKSFCYGNALYDVCPIPFYGKYNDYGAVEDCHGFGLPIVLNTIKHSLFEFDEGDNQYHDIPVKVSDFDIEKLFDADHEDRLGIIDTSSWDYREDRFTKTELEVKKIRDGGLSNADQHELDLLYARLAQPKNAFRRVTHVIIHRDIFDDIINKYYLSEYVGAKQGTRGWDNSYTNIYFENVIADIPAHIEKIKAEVEIIKTKGSDSALSGWHRYDVEGWQSKNHASRLLSYFGRGGENEYGLIDVTDSMRKYIKQDDWEGLESFITEALTGWWISNFMSATRKVWTQQTGMGSQRQDHAGYEVLVQSISDILTTEKSGHEDE